MGEKARYDKNTGWLTDPSPFPAPDGAEEAEMEIPDGADPWVTPTGYRWKVEGGEMVLAEYETEESKAQKKRNEIAGIEAWFDAYDLQVKEYERAVRLGDEPSLHIGDTEYAGIKELDEAAKEKAAALKALRSE